MGVPERPVEYMLRLQTLEQHIENQQFEEADALLRTLKGELGHDDPVLSGLEWELENEKSYAHDH